MKTSLMLFTLSFLITGTSFASAIVCNGNYNGEIEISLDASNNLSIKNVSVSWKGKNTLSLKNEYFECTDNFYKDFCTFEVDVLENIADGGFPNYLKIENSLLEGRTKLAKGIIQVPDVMFNSYVSLSCRLR